MPDSRAPSPDGTNPSFPEGESIVERAMRKSFEERQKEPGGAPFTQDDHRAIAESGAADLSGREKSAMFERMQSQASSKPATATGREQRTIPLFFGSWSGMNPFRFVKPFFLQKKKKDG